MVLITWQLVIRSQYPQLSSAEASQNDNIDKKSTDSPVDYGKSINILQRGLITDTKEDCDAKNSLQSEPCSSSGCIEEYLADFKDVDCLNTAYSDTTSLKGTDNASKSLFSGSKESKVAALRFDDKSGLCTDAATVVEAHLDLLEKTKKDIQGKPKSDAEPINVEEEQKDGAPNKCLNIESGLLVSHAFEENDCQNSHSEVTTRAFHLT